MKTKRLGSTELQLTVIGLGTWAIGSGGWEYGWGPQDDDRSTATIMRAIELGINWIDTAAIYGCGHAEEVITRALKEMRQKPIIATKCGIEWDSNGKIYRHVSGKRVRQEIEQSLRRLEIEPIDLYQIHWPIPDENIEQAWEEMAKLVEEGKVRYIGVSNFNVNHLERIRKIYPPASVQPPYSMVRPEPQQELLGYCAENKIGVLAYSPMAKGLLTGRFSAERLAQLAEDDHRRHLDPEFQEPGFSATMELVEGLKSIAQRYGRTCAQLAIAWVLRRSEVTAAIVGARKPYQIEETAKAGNWCLSEDDIAEIEDLLKKRQESLGQALV